MHINTAKANTDHKHVLSVHELYTKLSQTASTCFIFAAVNAVMEQRVSLVMLINLSQEAWA